MSDSLFVALEVLVMLVVGSPRLVWHNPLWLLGGRGNSMVREMYFLLVECNEFDRK